MFKYGKCSQLLVLLVFLPSCTKKVINKQDTSDPAYFFSHNEQFEDFDLIEKRQSHFQNRKKNNNGARDAQSVLGSLDFPVALDAYNIQDMSEDLITHYVYNTSLQVNALIDFYQQEMEYSGWQEFFVSTNQQGLAIFNRPGKVCVVHCKPEKSKRLVSIWLGASNY